MQTDKHIVLDTCALLPNCHDTDDSSFNTQKWRSFLQKNNNFYLSITPFTLYEILTIKDEKRREKLLNYLIKYNFDVLSYRNFPGLQTHQICHGIEWLPHLKCLIVYECNRLMEGMALDFILSRQEIDFNPSNSKQIIHDLNNFESLDHIAGKVTDLKAWFNKSYFDAFLENVVKILAKNCHFRITIDELKKWCLANSGKLYGHSSFSDITSEDRFLSRYILTMSMKKTSNHKMINYVIDALNLHSVFQKYSNAYFITRDKETIQLFFEASKHGVTIQKEKEDFLKSFLI